MSTDAAPGTARDLALRVLPRVDELAERLVEGILSARPDYFHERRPDDVAPLRDYLYRSCRDNLGRVLQMVAGGAAPSDRGPGSWFDAARATGTERSRQRVPLDDVLASYRLGGRMVWQSLLDQARADGVVDLDGLLEVGTRVWEVVDAVSSQVAASYHQAEQDLVRADQLRRDALWDGLLAGAAADPAFAREAAAALGLPADGALLVVVDTGSDQGLASGAGTRGDPSLRDSLRLDSLTSAWQPRGSSLVGVVHLDRHSPDVALTRLRRSLRGPAGVSLPVQGLAQVGLGYGQADLARRTLGAATAGVAPLAERLAEAMLLGAPVLAQAVVGQWLGSVLSLPESERDLLLETLSAWVGTAGSASATSALVHCHRNTVLNRVRRLEQLTGMSLSQGAEPLDLQLALRAVPLLSVPG